MQLELRSVALFDVHSAPGIGIFFAGLQLGIEYVPAPRKDAGIAPALELHVNTADPVARHDPPIAAHLPVTEPAALMSR